MCKKNIVTFRFLQPAQIEIDHFLCNGMGESIGYNQKEGSQEVFQTGIALVFHLFDQDRSKVGIWLGLLCVLNLY